MDKKIPFQNRVFAFFLSLFFSIALIVSMFAFPIELVMFNLQNYRPILEKEENLSKYPEIVSQALVSEFIKVTSPSSLPKILTNTQGLEVSLEKNISQELSLSIFNELFSQILDYLNFRTPNLSLNLDISQLKSELILKSEQIASDYLSTLSRCSADMEKNLVLTDIGELPPCKPSSNLIKSFQSPTAIYIEDLLNHLPEKASLNGTLTFNKTTIGQYFYFYSIGRWALRLLPICAIGLLIIIALLLRDEKKVMLQWIGRLLVFTSGIGLIGLVILLIGFDQFVVLILNKHLINFIEGFGILLLGIAQAIGYQTLIWVIISFAAVSAFGILLLMVNRFIKPRTAASSEVIDEIGSPLKGISPSEPFINGEQAQKEIIPETLEEIEAEEKFEKEEF